MPLHFSTINFALVLCCLSLASAWGQVSVRSGVEPQRLFAGDGRVIELRLHNPANIAVTLDGRIRLLQTSSTTVVPVADWPWKKMEVLPGQTILESATVSIPVVKAETRFFIQWLETTNKVLGTTEVLVYPTNLLAELKPLAGDALLGIFDPANQLQPLLRALAVECQDLVEEGTDKFHGQLALFGPFDSRQQMRPGLAEEVRSLAKRGVAVVWLQPPPERHAALKPSFYTVRAGPGTVVVAQGDMVSRLAENPQAQLNLIRLAMVALHPEPLDLPATRNSN